MKSSTAAKTAHAWATTATEGVMTMSDYMTREEAITILTETQVVYFAPNGKEKVQEALNMAIEALQWQDRILTQIEDIVLKEHGEREEE